MLEPMTAMLGPAIEVTRATEALGEMEAADAMVEENVEMGG